LPHAAVFRLVESAPVETSLDTALPDAADVWLELIRGARTSLDFAQFYVSDNPDGPSRLTPILAAIREAPARGVRVRFLVEEKFYAIYPTWVDELAATDGIEVRRLDSEAAGGGVLHAKYFIADDARVFVGSQNFDWRALEHIQELGVALDDSLYARDLARVFALDWAIAGLVPPGRFETGQARAVADSLALLVTRHERVLATARIDRGDTLLYQLAASPTGRLPQPATWDLPTIASLIDGARTSVSVQLLTYRPKDRDGRYDDTLDAALRRAAGRGVTVRLLVSNWGKRPGTVEWLKALAASPGVEVRFLNIPEWSGGFVPFSRTIHAKYMVVDARAFWIGTSNWERDYFYRGRNVGLIGESPAVGSQFDAFFEHGWSSEYAETVRCDAEYTPPRVAE
jgi:phosphatidylserine/phosphatidylglycerophosphate/cardiolipin synthase-like enzyme